MKLGKNVVLYKNAKIGTNQLIEDFVILGKPPRGFEDGQLPLVIGDSPVIRSGTIIYAGNVIGDKFQTGDNARIRENNKIGDEVSVGAGSIVETGCDIRNRVKIHSNCFVCEYTLIEENAWIGPNVTMTNVLHPPCPAFKSHAPVQGAKCCHGPIIKKNAVVGAGAVILPGIVIGENAVVGAGAVVTDEVVRGCVVTGDPARVVKKVEDLDCPLGFYEKGEVYSWRKS